MLLAIVKRLRAMYPDAALTMVPSAPNGSEPFTALTELGFYPKASLLRGGIEWGAAAGLIPAKLRRRYGLVLEREVDVVVDAAGFAYSDQWGVQPALELARATRRWRRRGTKVILMPQAFGPFENRDIRSAMRSAVENADLVMPRDATSYRHLTEVTGERDYIRQYPDFTNLLEGVVPNDYDSGKFGVALVPNYRMIDKTRDVSENSYVAFMKTCVRRLQELDARPFMLIHEGEDDERLAQEISSDAIPVVKEEDPLRLKGILGASRAVVASRFHALVSALSQGVPTVATGWSHKYTELFSDYGFPAGILSVNDDARRINEMLDSIVEASAAKQISAQLIQKSHGQKVLAEKMWSEVDAVIKGSRR
jgi:colanic acid/amylovoran biosynthesis protein